MSSLYQALAPLQQAILCRILQQANAFKAFDAASLLFYAQHVGEPITAAQAQKAMARLREHEPPLVWKSLRGEYSLYDIEMLDWYGYLVAEMAWPPVCIAQ